MPKIFKKTHSEGLVNLERLAHIIQGLTPSELETLDLLIDDDALSTISESLQELDRSKGIPINEW